MTFDPRSCADRPQRRVLGGVRAKMVDVDSPSVSVPAVADALRHVTISGVFYCPSFLREPWGGAIPAMPGCVWFHAVTTGRCTLAVGDDRIDLQAGDLALVPHGSGHLIEAGCPTVHPSIPDLPHDQQSDNYAVLRYGGDGALTELVCGGLRLEHPSARHLIESLPSIIHVRTVRYTAIGATLDQLADEVQRRDVGNEAVISRLCDILVIQAVRHWMTSDAATQSSWLRAMSDPRLGAALAALHEAPAAPWTVASLAPRASMSRSAFAAAFSDVIGQPVMGYLTDLRMQLAVDLLHHGGHTVAEVATAVGYESDASFSRVFKRRIGTSPSVARRAG
jgi:AraC-like DNA-binding protein